MGQRAGLVLAAALASAGLAAQAQQKSPDQPAPTPQTTGKPATPAKAANRTVEGVTVTGAAQNGFRSDIDRKSYGIASDLATTTGSISDALRNIPSVEVDPQGNVSLRGDTNVTILLDGKPSGQFKGATAAQALQAMPADSIERVEVITNPSAEFSPEGSAGIINLISKKTRKAGGSGSLRLSYGDHERRQAGITGAYNSDKLTLSGDANGRWDPQPVNGVDDRQLLDGAGHTLSLSQIQNDNFTHIDLWGGRAGIDYDADKTLRLSGEARFNHFDIDTAFHQVLQGEDATGTLNQAYVSAGRGTFGRGDGEAQASLRKTFAGDDHTLSLSLSRERIDEERDVGETSAISLPSASNSFFEIRTFNNLTQTQAKADYARPMPGDGKLKAGFDLRTDDNHYDQAGLRGPSLVSAGPDPTQTNLFLYKQTVDAAYATYEQPFGDWTVLGGIRLEEVELDLNQVTSGDVHDSRYFRAYPTVHVADRLSDAQQLTFSYSRRVQRPNPEDLNSFRVESDPLNFHAGNPNLQPQTTDSFEAGYQYRAGGAFYLATFYYRRSEHGVTSVLTPLAGDAFLTTTANLTASRSAGLELVANGHLTKTLGYNVSSNLYWNEIDATGQGLEQLVDFAGRRSAFEVGGRASLTWDPTPKDTFQFSANYNPKRLTPQGFTLPNFLSYLGYRHRFADNLFGLVTVQDPFDSLRFEQTIDTPTLKQRTDSHIHIRGVFFGVTRTFGSAGKKPREPGFDFGGGQ
jgi:outer membrane receptor protein involved in Fe transport